MNQSPEDQAAEQRARATAKQRVARTEALLEQVRKAADPVTAQKLTLRASRFTAIALTLSDNEVCQLRVLATALPGQPEIKISLQRREPRDDRWHEMSLSPADQQALRQFVALHGGAAQLLPSPLSKAA